MLQKWRKARKKCLGRFCFDLLRLFLGVVDVRRVDDDGNLMVMAVIVMGGVIVVGNGQMWLLCCGP